MDYHHIIVNCNIYAVLKADIFFKGASLHREVVVVVVVDNDDDDADVVDVDVVCVVLKTES